MSCIYFHSQHGETRVSGRERHWAASLVREMFLTAAHARGSYFNAEERHRWLSIFPPGHPIHSTACNPFGDTLVQWLGGFTVDTLVLAGEERSIFRLSLNSAIALGSDPIRLMARLHGQCEIHAYVEGSNRAWLANFIDEGLDRGILHAPPWGYEGWQAAAALLRSRDDEPVVTSYSVCRQFPDPEVALNYGNWTAPPDPDYPDETNCDAWYDLPESEQWRLCLEALRADSEVYTLEMKPENWSNYHFGEEGLNGCDIQRLMWASEEAAR